MVSVRGARTSSTRRTCTVTVIPPAAPSAVSTSSVETGVVMHVVGLGAPVPCAFSAATTRTYVCPQEWSVETMQAGSTTDTLDAPILT